MQLKTVIVADDEEIIRKYIKELLSDLGIHVLLCADGKELFQLLNQHNLYLDLIILDLGMPEINGIVALQKMADIKALKNFKVCILSGHHDEKVVNRVISLQPDDYIVKPFDEDVFLNKIKKLLDLKNIDSIKHNYTKVNFPATLINYPMSLSFLIIGLSEDGVILESPVNFKEQSLISFLCRTLADLIDVDHEFDIKIIKVKIEHDKFIISANFLNFNENIKTKIREFIIGNSTNSITLEG